jgi:hypothetical protein
MPFIPGSAPTVTLSSSGEAAGMTHSHWRRRNLPAICQVPSGSYLSVISGAVAHDLRCAASSSGMGVVDGGQILLSCPASTVLEMVPCDKPTYLVLQSLATLARTGPILL